MNASTKQMAKIDEIVQDAVQKVEVLDKNSHEITKLVSVIQDIADQTNLLALNAAIEAARAGEHGQGFAVVANEVRKLAEEVSASVTDITNIVERNHAESNAVTEALHSGYDEVSHGATQIKETGETFNQINTSVMNMAERISVVSGNLSEIVASSQQMNSSIQEIAAISEQSAAGVEQTTASSQQTSSAMEEVVENTNELATLAEDLNQLGHKYKFLLFYFLIGLLSFPTSQFHFFIMNMVLIIHTFAIRLCMK